MNFEVPTEIDKLSLKHYREAVEQAGHSIYVTDPNGAILYVNPAFEETTGYSADEALGADPSILKSGEHDEEFYRNLWETISSGKIWRGEVINQRKDGTRYVIDQTIAPITADHDEEPGAYVAINQDITTRKRYEETLEEREKTLQLALEAADAGSWTWDPETNEQHWDKAIYNLCGINPDDDPDLLSVVHPEDRQDVQQKAVLYGRKAQQCVDPGEYKQEFRIRKNDEVRWLEVRGRYYHPPNHSRGHVIGITIDVTEKKRMQQALRNQALYDTLTELPNRDLLEDRLNMMIRRCQRHEDWPFALVFLDLDQFKEINDIYGHSFGDELLVQVARRIQESLRDEDTVARIGGDEFVILLEDVDSRDNVEKALFRLREDLNRPFRIENQKVSVTYSFGVQMATKDYHDSENLFRNADAAMYRAKQDSSRNQYYFAENNQELNDNTPDLRDDLTQAIKNGNLTVHYQPIVDPDKGRTIALEALVRWPHSDHGLLTPDDFFPTAKEAGILPELDRYVINCVLADLEELSHEPNSERPEWISVNLSPQFFLKEEALEYIIESIEERDVPPDALRLELSEKTATKKKEFTRDNLTKLREHDLRLGIDDFGTGYSSFRNLKSLPVDFLKTDRELLDVPRRTEKDGSPELLETTVGVARLLKTQSIVKGVETDAQWERVRKLDPHLVQGYRFGKPRPFSEIRKEFITRKS